MPQPVAELEKPDPGVGRDDVAVLVEIGEIGDALRRPLLDLFADMARAAVGLERAELTGEGELLFVAQILVAKHQHRIFVHAGLNRGDLIDAAWLWAI